MGMLHLRHVFEDLGRLRILGAQLIGIGEIDPRIILLGGNGEGQDFLFGKLVEGPLAALEGETEHGIQTPVLELF